MMRTPTLALITATLLMPTVASAEDELTSLSYIAYLERYATVQPAHENEPLEAIANMPLMSGDRIDTAREGRMEIVLSDGNMLWVDEYTTLSLDAVAYARDTAAERTVLYLAEGSVMLELSEYALPSEPVRVDGSDATVYLQEAGLYRLDTLRNGGLRLEVWQGLAEASTTAGGVLVRPESATEVYGGNASGAEPRLTWGDGFARWVEQRRQQVEGPSAQRVDARFSRQASELDAYGNWIFVDDLGLWAWRPTVSASWRPYTAGRWYWTPVGWSWISYEPWGWLPSHYGSWHFSVSFGWVWSYHSYWSPAWVSWAYWPGYVGWCPTGYYSGWYYDHYWHHHPHPPGAGNPRPPRGDVIPPRQGGDRRVAVRSDQPPVPVDRVALDISGRAQLEAVDRRAWNVVSDREFASPHLSRAVRPGEVAMRGVENVEAVVHSGALRTAAPSRRAPSEALATRFGDIRRTATADVTPILARDASLEPATARALAQPTTVDDAARVRADAPAATDGPDQRMVNELSLSRSAFAREDPTAVRSRADVRIRGRAPTAERPTRNPFLTRSARAPAEPSDGGAVSDRRPLVVSPSTPSRSISDRSIRAPSVQSPSRVTPSTSRATPSTPTVRRSTAPRSSSRPVIIPRTSSTRSGSPGMRSGGSRSTPSVSSRSGGAVRRSPSVSSGGSRGGGSVRSAPSSGSSSAPRSSVSSSGSARSSGGSARKQ